MAQTPCIKRADGETINFTASGAKLAGTVMVSGSNLVTIIPLDVADGDLGAQDLEGLWEVPKVTGSITKGAPLYWDSDGDPLGGTAGSGAFSSSSAVGPFAGWAAETSAGNTIRMLLRSVTDAASPVLRSDLGEDSAAVYAVPLTSLLTHATMVTLGSAAGTPSGDCGLTPGTFGSASPVVIGESASGNSKSDACRFLFKLPAEYVAGGDITLRVHSMITGNVNVAQTVDASAYLTDGAAGIGSDLVTTSAITLTTSFADHDFTITPTSLVAGNILDIQLTIAANDTGASNNKLCKIGAVSLLLDIKG